MNIRFDRNELSGAFGDIGTDLPLVVGLILVTGLDAASVFLMFGLMQIVTGLIYGVPMPAQPLKLVAVIAISAKLSDGLVLGAGLAIGITMLILTVSGILTWISKVVPNSVIRGIQFGLGMKLILLAFTSYIPAEGLNGYIISTVSFILVLLLLKNRRLPPALPVIALGIIYAFIFRIEPGAIVNNFGFVLPEVTIPGFHQILTGFVILAIPQIPLSIGNSILATEKVSEDLFPEKKLKAKKIAYTYSLMNLINPFLGGVPVCHGSGGMVGHYTFGARTGGSVIIYGILYLIIGLFCSRNFEEILQIFPLSILGTILVFEGFALSKLIKKTLDSRDLIIALVVGFMAILFSYGFVLGLIAGTVLHYVIKKLNKEP